MEIKIINRTTNTTSRQLYLSRLKDFLKDMSCDYPFFDEWLAHAFSRIKSGERSVVLCLSNDKIAGAVILKKASDEKKICTIRVASEYRRQGIGTMLMIKALEYLNEDLPLITVSDEHIHEFRPFLAKFGFMEMSRVKSVYRYGHDEFYFNNPYLHQCVLMSIRPKYANAIMSGKKTVEFRRKCFPRHVRKVYVYSSTPVRRIIGYFEVDKIVVNSPSSLWIRYGRKGSINKVDFEKYFDGKNQGYAIIIKRAVKLRQELEIKDVFDNRDKVYVPQNYMYIDNVVMLRRLLLVE